MAFDRLFFAILIAVSVTLAPAIGSSTVSVSTPKMAMTDQTDIPCCCPSPDDAKASVACAFKCLSFVATTFPGTRPLVHIADRPPQSLSDNALSEHVIPPRHPPPI
jgi:hypothetical protein